MVVLSFPVFLFVCKEFSNIKCLRVLMPFYFCIGLAMYAILCISVRHKIWVKFKNRAHCCIEYRLSFWFRIIKLLLLVISIFTTFVDVTICIVQLQKANMLNYSYSYCVLKGSRITPKNFALLYMLKRRFFHQSYFLFYFNQPIKITLKGIV